MLLPPPRDYEPDPMPDEDNGRPSKYGVLFGFIVCGNLWRVVDTLPVNNLWSTPTLLIVAKAAFGAAAWVYVWMFTDLFIWPAVVAWWNSYEQPPKSAPETTETPKREPTPARTPQNGTRANGGGNGENVDGQRLDVSSPTRQAEQTATFVHWLNDHVISVDGTTADLRHYEITRQRWNEIKAARQQGQLDTISPNALYEILKVPNRGADSEADRVIELMVDLGLIQATGDRRPYVFTALGDGVLPQNYQARSPELT